MEIILDVYRAAVRALPRCLPLLIGLVVLTIAFDFVWPEEYHWATLAIIFLVHFLLEFTTYRVTLNTASSTARLHPFIRMAVWSFLFGIAVSVISIGLMLVIAIIPQQTGGTGFLAAGVLSGLFYAMLLARFGTVLPAAATDGPEGLGAANRRGQRTFLTTILRLFGGPTPFFVLGLVLPFFGGGGDVLAEDFRPSATLSVIAALAYAASVYLTAVTLALAYAEAERHEM